MRHRNYGGKLGRTSAHRKALLRNLVTALLDHERIETTDAKARELKRMADRMITLGKRGDLHARRQALAVIRSREVTGKVFGDLAERFRSRPGGYTRVLKVRIRVGDAAPLSLVELVEGKKAEAKRAKSDKAAKVDKAGKAAAKASGAKAEGKTGRVPRKRAAPRAS